jgi:fructose-specific phosphotransferase system IIC component
MRGIPILIAFFSTFLAASLLIPSPIFPGNIICTFIGNVADEYLRFLGAIFNGIFYGTILWLVFVVVSRRFEKEK